MKKVIREANGRVRVQTVNEKPSVTQQQFAPQCEIKNIMKKFRDTGQVGHLNSKPFLNQLNEVFDSTVLPQDYQAALDLVFVADNAFKSLTADVRSRFGNDPRKLLEFMNDKKNHAEAVKLGLIEPAKPDVALERHNELVNAIKNNANLNAKNKNAKTKSVDGGDD